jgi:hypothetical protein
MNTEERNKLIANFFNTKCRNILETKGKASSGGTQDTNQNFKEAQLGDRVDDLDVWWIYYIKHVTRLKNFIVNREKIGETLEETIADLVNYPLILYTILVEKGMITSCEKKIIEYPKEKCTVCNKELFDYSFILYRDNSIVLCSNECKNTFNKRKNNDDFKCTRCGVELFDDGNHFIDSELNRFCNPCYCIEYSVSQS